MKRLFAVATILALIAVCASAEERNLQKWQNRLLEGYQYMRLTVDRLPRMVLLENGPEGPRRYFVFTYRLSNISEKPFVLRPCFELHADTDANYPEVFSEDVLHQVRLMNGTDYLSTQQVLQRLLVDPKTGERKKDPLLMPGDSVFGAAVFHEINPKADHLDVYAFGLANSFKVEQSDHTRVPMIEARVVSFYRPGDRFHPERDIELASEDWKFVPVPLTMLNPALLPPQ
ncbi:MAG: hypothetical protein V2A58_15475 [Planctomycetota bacterium]